MSFPTASKFEPSVARNVPGVATLKSEAGVVGVLMSKTNVPPVPVMTSAPRTNATSLRPPKLPLPREATRTGTSGFDTSIRSTEFWQPAPGAHGRSVAGKSAATILPFTARRR